MDRPLAHTRPSRGSERATMGPLAARTGHSPQPIRYARISSVLTRLAIAHSRRGENFCCPHTERGLSLITLGIQAAPHWPRVVIRKGDRFASAKLMPVPSIHALIP